MTALIADLDRETITLLDAAGFYRSRDTRWEIVAERLELSPWELFALLRRHRARYRHYEDWHRKELHRERYHGHLAQLRREFRNADTKAKKTHAAGRLQAETMRRDGARIRQQLDNVRKQIRLAREERAANRALREITVRGAPPREWPRRRDEIATAPCRGVS